MAFANYQSVTDITVLTQEFAVHMVGVLLHKAVSAHLPIIQQIAPCTTALAFHIQIL
jgi:hypothetical protein